MRTRLIAAALALLPVCGFAGLTLWMSVPEPPDPQVANEDAYWKALELVENTGAAAEERCGEAGSRGRRRGRPPCPKR